MKKGLSKIAMALFAAGLAFNVSAADIKVAVASDATSLDPQEQLDPKSLESMSRPTGHTNFHALFLACYSHGGLAKI